MLSRRVLLAGAAGTVAVAAGAVVATGRVDDALQAAGVRPTPLPTGPDVALAEAARADVDALLALARRQGADDVTVALLEGQAKGWPATTRTVAPPASSLSEACRAAAVAREKACEAAVSTDLAVVLASSAAGLHQLVTHLSGSP